MHAVEHAGRRPLLFASMVTLSLGLAILTIGFLLDGNGRVVSSVLGLLVYTIGDDYSVFTI